MQSNTLKLYKNYREIRNQNRNMYLKFWSRSDNFKISIPSLAVHCSFWKLPSLRPWATLYYSCHFINESETWYILMKKTLTEFSWGHQFLCRMVVTSLTIWGHILYVYGYKVLITVLSQSQVAFRNFGPNKTSVLMISNKFQLQLGCQPLTFSHFSDSNLKWIRKGSMRWMESLVIIHIFSTLTDYFSRENCPRVRPSHIFA